MKKKKQDLPWWVELLFVQMGLPDNLLIKILNAKKKTKDLFKKDKKLLIIFFSIISIMAYLYPPIKHAKNKLDCQKVAQNYITENKNITRINKKELKMLSINFCSGGEQIYEIENSKI